MKGSKLSLVSQSDSVTSAEKMYLKGYGYEAPPRKSSEHKESEKLRQTDKSIQMSKEWSEVRDDRYRRMTNLDLRLNHLQALGKTGLTAVSKTTKTKTALRDSRTISEQMALDP